MKKFYRSFFLTQRFFNVGWALVVVFTIGYFSSIFFGIAKMLLLLSLVIVALETFALYRVRQGINGSRNTFEKWSNGDQNPVHFTIQSRYPVALHARIIDELPFQFQERELQFNGHLEASGKMMTEYAVRPVSRGIYRYGALNVFISTGMRLVERRYVLDAEKEVAVYPSFLQLRKFELFAISDRLTMAGIKKIRRVARSTEFDRIKEYVTGDDRRTMNWKATARRSRLMVNQYQDEKSQQMYSLIDLGRVMKMPFDGLSLLDHAINASLVISNIAMHKDDKAGLITFSNKVHGVLKASKRRSQMLKVQEMLYAQSTDHAETDMEALYFTVRQHLKQRSLLMLFTNFESVQAMNRQLPYLQKLARTHLLVVIFFINTELEEDLHKAPSNTEELYVHTITDQFMHQKHLIAKELERRGILTILTRPEALTVNVINKYLEIKARALL